MMMVADLVCGLLLFGIGVHFILRYWELSRLIGFHWPQSKGPLGVTRSSSSVSHDCLLSPNKPFPNLIERERVEEN